ncbi:hypothetical protein E6A70_03475 [Staphylococcus pseudintermedius]|uniref:hypothetical protein n=1 Tax=Staphylococcus pseudintermedius TaxID=283734 RepID=UPI000CDE8BB2|nr:hypothetical protein [Staphylococcus pseudintermedius]EGQ1725615.1 hypothetical protein [Staphylococcus pseudintermedius]EGQ2895610.1 hypothetical protein [Staphylococcus pseudintermedius]EGQ3746585.1 hypothetical protein [Staphylococcus pseudintermedius]EGQ3775437.1 hypothetical protein [Staphylococcus pseudintermedius]EHT3160173.1 hypothetical protein [Staphylococcus pseudintermedius]
MNIKVKKEMNLLELFEYIKKNEIADKVFFDNKGKGKVVVGDDRYLYMTDLNLTDTFTVETVKEIKEETVIPLLVETYLNPKGEPSCYSYRNKSINYILENNKSYNNTPPTHIYMLNDDMTMTLIWKDGELVK